MEKPKATRPNPNQAPAQAAQPKCSAAYCPYNYNKTPQETISSDRGCGCGCGGDCGCGWNCCCCRAPKVVFLAFSFSIVFFFLTPFRQRCWHVRSSVVVIAPFYPRSRRSHRVQGKLKIQKVKGASSEVDSARVKDTESGRARMREIECRVRERTL